MVLNRMSADMKTWVDAAISRHLRDGASLDDVRTCFVGGLLAQMLLYYRYDVPGKWEGVYNNADLLGLGKRLADTPGLVGYCTLGPPALPDYAAIYEALETDCWSSYERLSAVVWRMLSAISGLTKEEWQSLPGLTEEALVKTMVCSRCGYADNLAGFGEVTEYADPFTFSGGTRIHLRCKRCGEKVTFESGAMQVEKYRPKVINARGLIIGAGITTMLLIVAALVKYAS